MNRNLRDYRLDIAPNTSNALYPINTKFVGDYSALQSVSDNFSTSIYFDVMKNEFVETEEYFSPI